MSGITYAIYPLQVGLPPARGAELATIQKDVTALDPLPIPLHQKNTKFVVTTWVLSSSQCTKTRFRPGLCPGPRWGSLRRSSGPPSRLGRGTPPFHSPPPRRLRRLVLATIPLLLKEIYANAWGCASGGMARAVSRREF